MRRVFAYRGLEQRGPKPGSLGDFLLSAGMLAVVIGLPAIIWLISRGLAYLRAVGWEL